MRYGVEWVNCRTGRAGKTFSVDAVDPVRGFLKACEHVQTLSPYLEKHFHPIDIRSLKDEKGNLCSQFLTENEYSL